RQNVALLKSVGLDSGRREFGKRRACPTTRKSALNSRRSCRAGAAPARYSAVSTISKCLTCVGFKTRQARASVRREAAATVGDPALRQASQQSHETSMFEC